MEGQQRKNIELADEKIEEFQKKANAQGKTDFEQIRKENVSHIAISTAPEPKKESSIVKNLRTYQGDVAEIIKSKNTSVVSVAVAEKKKKEKVIKETPPAEKREIKKNVLLATTSLVLIIIGIGSIYFFYTLQKNEVVPIQQTNSDDSILPFADKQTYSISELSRQRIIEIFDSQTNSWNGARNDILYLELISPASGNKISSDSFFSSLNTRAPDSLIRSFGEKMMVGLIQQENGVSPFLLVELSSFENAFDGMLRWEKEMYADIGKILSDKKIPIISTPITDGNEMEQEQNISIATFEAKVNQNFEDLTVRNRDSRVLKNEYGEVVLLYSFLNRKTLLITSREAVFRSMIDKMLSGNFLR